MSNETSASSACRIDPPHRGGFLWILLTVLLVGTLLRLVTIVVSSAEYTLPGLSPSVYGWPVRSRQLHAMGSPGDRPCRRVLLAVHPAARPGGDRPGQRGGKTYVHHGDSAPSNYPPGALYLVWAQGTLHRLLDPDLIVNTRGRRARVLSAPGCRRRHHPGTWDMATRCSHCSGGGSGLIAASTVFMLPPVWLDSCWWGQTESWVLAPAVWMLVAMARRRWIAGGVLWGLALSA